MMHGQKKNQKYCYYSLHNNPKQGSSHLIRGGSLKITHNTTSL